jgi:hypothetical protein
MDLTAQTYIKSQNLEEQWSNTVLLCDRRSAFLGIDVNAKNLSLVSYLKGKNTRAVNLNYRSTKILLIIATSQIGRENELVIPA